MGQRLNTGFYRQSVTLKEHWVRIIYIIFSLSVWFRPINVSNEKVKVFKKLSKENSFQSTCQELGSCHPLLTTNKKLNRLKSQQLFLDLLRDWGTQEKLLSFRLERQTGENKESLLTVEGTSARETWTVIDELLETQCGQIRDLKTPRGFSNMGTPTIL